MRLPSKYLRNKMAAPPLVLGICLALILPALSRATMIDYSAPTLPLTGGPNGASTSPPSRDNPMIQHVAVFVPPPVFPAPKLEPTTTGIVQRPIEPVYAANSNALTPEETQRLRQVIEPGRATALEVAAVNIAVKGTSLLMYFVVWCVGLWILRREFDYWFDEDVYSQTWPSVVVIVALLVCTAWVLVSTVQ